MWLDHLLFGAILSSPMDIVRWICGVDAERIHTDVFRLFFVRMEVKFLGRPVYVSKIRYTSAFRGIPR